MTRFKKGLKVAVAVAVAGLAYATSTYWGSGIDQGPWQPLALYLHDSGFSSGDCLPQFLRAGTPQSLPFLGPWGTSVAGQGKVGVHLLSGAASPVRFYLSAPARVRTQLIFQIDDAFALGKLQAAVGTQTIPLPSPVYDHDLWRLNFEIPENCTQAGENTLELQGTPQLRLTNLAMEVTSALEVDGEDLIVPFGRSFLIPLPAATTGRPRLRWLSLEPQLQPGVADGGSWQLVLSLHGQDGYSPKASSLFESSRAAGWTPSALPDSQNGSQLCLRLEAKSPSCPSPGQLGIRIRQPKIQLSSEAGSPLPGRLNTSTRAPSPALSPSTTPTTTLTPTSSVALSQVDGGSRACNVLILLVDTLRADHLGCYGCRPSVTPNLDRFAQSAVVFKNCWAQAPWTKPATASILTGHYPWKHRAEDFADVVDPKIENLAQILSKARASYRCSGVVTNYFVSQDFGFSRGFSHYDFVHEASFKQVNSKVRDLLEGQRGPFFLYLHTLEPHAPYAPPRDTPGFENCPAFENSDMSHLIELLGRARLEGQSKELQAHIDQLLLRARRAYAGEVAATDSAFGDLVTTLQKRGLYDNTMIVVVADHGEEFLEHGWLGHINTLYPEVIQVPLLIKFPNQKAGVVVSQSAQQVDILPTILAACQQPVDPQLPGRIFGADGQARKEQGPIFYRLRAGKDAQRFGQGENRWADLTGVSHQGWDLHQAHASNQCATVPPLELFNWSLDSQERTNLAFRQLGPQAHLELLLRRSNLPRESSSAASKMLDKSRLEDNLRSLQYVR